MVYELITQEIITKMYLPQLCLNILTFICFHLLSKNMKKIKNLIISMTFLLTVNMLIFSFYYQFFFNPLYLTKYWILQMSTNLIIGIGYLTLNADIFSRFVGITSLEKNLLYTLLISAFTTTIIYFIFGIYI
jgi:hypothetical protein